VNYYYDTSALCRNYHPEAGSDKVERLLQDSNSRHVISRVTFLELQSAFALKVRTGEISVDDFTLLRRRFRADVNRRTLKVVRLLRRHYDRAEKLLLQHAMSKRLRTLDSIHLAVALDLRDSGLVDAFVTADALLVSVGRAGEMTVIDPGEP
jgi:predicted nucleic acid-binding protein